MGEGLCRACDSKNLRPYLADPSLGISRCVHCGVIFRNQEVQLEELRSTYDENYYLKTWPGSLGRFFGDFEPSGHHKTRFFSRQLRDLESALGGPGRLLDVGCANGVFLHIAKERGWDAKGVEISGFAAEWGRKQFGADILEGTIHDVPSEPSFDLITFWDVIEHLPEPRKDVAAAYQRLRPGGILVALTPDAASLVNTLVHAVYRLWPSRARPLMDKLYHDDHLYFFDADSLGRLLVQEGFRVGRIKGYDESPRDTETSGLLFAVVGLVRFLAALIGRRHEMMIWACKDRCLGELPQQNAVKPTRWATHSRRT